MSRINVDLAKNLNVVISKLKWQIFTGFITKFNQFVPHKLDKSCLRSTWWNWKKRNLHIFFCLCICDLPMCLKEQKYLNLQRWCLNEDISFVHLRVWSSDQYNALKIIAYQFQIAMKIKKNTKKYLSNSWWKKLFNIQVPREINSVATLCQG